MALWTEGEDVCLAIHRAMAVLYDRFLRRCPAAVRGLSLQTFGREVRSLGFPTAHRRRGNCYCVVEV